MKKETVSLGPAVLASEAVLPLRVQEALGELVGVAKEGLLALSVGVGLGVLAELMEEEVVEVVGAKGKHDPERAAVRHGHEAGEVTLGGRRVAVERPRVRSADGQAEVRLATYEHFVDRDPAVMKRIGELVEDDELVLTGRDQRARLRPRGLRGGAITAQVLALPCETLAHHQKRQARDRLGERALTRLPLAFDELHNRHAQAAPERAEHEPERRRGLALALARVHQQ